MGAISLPWWGTLVSEPSCGGGAERLLKTASRGLCGLSRSVVSRLGSLEFVLDEGQRDDWFGSNMILGLHFGLRVLPAWPLIPGIDAKDPIVDYSLVGERQFGSAFW